MIGFNKTFISKIKTDKGYISMDFSKKINKLIDNMEKRASYEMSDTYKYPEISEHITEKQTRNMKYKSIAMTLKQDADNQAQHMLEISILHPSMMLEIKRPLYAGSKDNILNYLKNLNPNDLIKNDINEMIEKLQTR